MSDKKRKVPITKPCFGEEETRAVREVLRSGWIVQGPQVLEFERLVAAYTGAQFAIAASSCTSALHLALLAAGIGPGDEVIVPSFTFIATANAVEYTGARAVFCDIDLDTFNMDPGLMESKITEKTRAIIPVHLFGLCADMERIMEITERRGLLILEDAACALGARIGDRHAGTFGAAGSFSFHPRKSITTGEGGMITTNKEEVAAACRSLRDHGASKSDLERHEKGGSLLPDYNIIGFNFRMTDIQGAIGVTQMARFSDILRRRREGARNYNEILRHVSWLRTPPVPDGYMHSYQSYVCLIRKDAFGGSLEKANLFRNRLMAELEECGIATRQGTHAVHTLGYYRDRYSIGENDCPRSLEADRLSMTIPLFAQMTDEDRPYVAEKIVAIGERLLCAE
ncbi:MAG: DegT/DnrJ/EryC1/StrS family aminotransferase [Candidatus Tritonobacter lacicola]|nr:DegT/DnrJ/EryC1/StrS family aminotransferase [Candidatus Tritonobacter lacicola]